MLIRTKAKPDPEHRARMVQDAHDRVVRQCAMMVQLLGAEETAAIQLSAIRIALRGRLGPASADALLRDVVARLGSNRIVVT